MQRKIWLGVGLLCFVSSSRAMKEAAPVGKAAALDPEAYDIAHRLAATAHEHGIGARHKGKKIRYYPRVPGEIFASRLKPFMSMAMKDYGEKLKKGIVATWFGMPKKKNTLALLLTFEDNPKEIKGEKIHGADKPEYLLTHATLHYILRANNVPALVTLIACSKKHVYRFFENDWDHTDSGAEVRTVFEDFKLLYQRMDFSKDAHDIFGKALVDLCEKEKKSSEK